MCVGGGLFVLGLVGDHRHWWKDVSFWPNVMTSLSGFFFGVPIALVLLATITQEREDKSQRDKLEQLSSTAWGQFVLRVTGFCATDRIFVLHLAAKQLAPLWADISTQIDRFAHGDHDPPWPQARDDEEHSAFVAKLRPWAGEVEGILRLIDGVLPAGSDLQVEWVGVQRSWAVLDTYVKLQRFELGLDRIDDQIDTRLQHKMLRDGNPIGDFSEMHDLTMPNIPAYLRRLADMNRVDRYISMHHRRGLLSSDRYAGNASAAAEFLELLRLDVLRAEEVGGWPGA